MWRTLTQTDGWLSRSGWLAVFLAAIVALANSAHADSRPTPGVTVIDHGLVPAVYPRYLGRDHGWQDVHNEDAEGRLWMRRELMFSGSRIPWRVFQTCANL